MVVAETNTLKKTPPVQAKQSIQMDFFTSFLSNDEANVSNTVEIWENIPKYFFTPKQVEKLRSKDGSAKPFEWAFTYHGKSCNVIIQPAFIKDSDGVTRAYFPSVTEELTEEALKKILTMQNMALHNVEKSETWVRFTLRMIQKELKNRGKARSLDQIKRSIQVMSRCILSVSVGKKEVWSGAILQDLVTVDRDEYIADNSAQHAARMPLFISHAINALDYRQFNYHRLMSCKEQLSRWIYKRLITRYRQASLMDDYHFMYSSLVCSGLLQQSRDRDNYKKVRSALDELITEGVLMSWKETPVKEGRRVVDVKYNINSGIEFMREQKAANKRCSDNKLSAVQKGAKPHLVDNLA